MRKYRPAVRVSIPASLADMVKAQAKLHGEVWTAYFLALIERAVKADAYLASLR
jgi:hypothetical protein